METPPHDTQSSNLETGRARFGVVIAVAAVVLWASSATAPAAELGLAGGRNIIWVHQTRSESPDDAKLLRFAFMPLEDKGNRFFLPLHQDEIGGEPRRIAVRGVQLHAFFEDGTHVRYAPVARSITTQQSQFWELKLPDSCVPLAVAGDSITGVLYAVVSGSIAELLPSGPTPQPTSSPVEPSTQPSDEPPPGLLIGPVRDATPASEATTQPVLAKYCLVRYERGAWWRDREIPVYFDDQAGCRLAALDGVCDLYFIRSGQDRAVHFARVDGEAWGEPEQLADASWDEVSACGIVDKKSIVVLNLGDRLVVLDRQGVRWAERTDIDNPTEGGWTQSGSKPVVCLADSVVAVAWTGAQADVHAGVWDMSGEAVVEPVVIEALAIRSKAPISQKAIDALPYVVLALAMLCLFTRRRTSVTIDANLRPNQALVSHGRRLLAFVLDALITAPVTMSVMSGWFEYVGGKGDLEANFKTAMADYGWELFWRWWVALAIYITYCILFEALRGGTPGKLLTGCRVVTEYGKRCCLGAIVVRNVLRCVEFFPRFEFAPTLVLVVLTRNRQRLGDLVARTVVVVESDEAANDAEGTENGQ